MPKSVVKVSERAPVEPPSDSVLDFLYNDARRIASFLSQFDDSGALDRVIQREGATKDQRRGIKIQFSGGASILGTGANGGFGFDRGPGDSGSESLERQYDPLWANALTLLDFLNERALIKTHLSKAGIGQFVRVTGRLAVHDLGSLKAMWEIPAAKRLMGFNQVRRGNKKDNDADGVEIGLEMIKFLPHAITARMETAGAPKLETWSTLAAGYITGSTSDLFLKHGARISGEWTMIGVLDAEPDLITPTSYSQEQNSALFGMHGLGHLLDLVGPVARSFLGRPSGAFGITPLVIYREVSR